MSRRMLVLALPLVAALLAALPAESRAQSSFGFSISSGGGHRHHHGHHHHHHHHPRWSFGYSVDPWCPGWYAPPPAIVYAPPVVQERVIYVQPPPSPPPVVVSPYSSTSQKTNTSVAADSPPTLPASSVTDDRIVIRNAAGASLPVAFVIDGQDVELPDGSVRTFVGRSHRTVQYDRGGRFGSTQQDLNGGQYEFRITASGWDLVRRPDITPTRTAVRTNSLPETR
jgi:hypothetical protein